MSFKHIDFPWVLAILAIIAGMVGGCGAASFQVLSGRQLTIAILLAYAMLGAALGAASFLILLITAPSLSIAHQMLIAGSMGAGSTMTVAAVRYGVRIILKSRGVEVDVRFRDPAECEGRRADDQ